MSDQPLASTHLNHPEVASLDSRVGDSILLQASPTPILSRPSVTVVVCTRLRPDALRSCLEAIGRLDPPADDVLVIDNSAGDAEAERVARESGARYLVEPRAGLSRARNRGLAESTTEIVAFMDDDGMPYEDWLGRLLPHFNDPNVASVSGDYIAPGVPCDPDRCAPIRSLSNRDPQWFEIATYGGLGRGSNMALRKSVCSVWRGFDPRLGRGAPLRIAEESHAYATLLSLGFRAVHVPGALVIHPVKPKNIKQEAISSIAYWLLLFFEFPGNRLEIVRFLSRRLRGKPLTWSRNPQKPGAIITSGWRVRLAAVFSGIMLYLRSLKLRGK
jgi:glycosyltransferase involved in cell wall biosynthesis